MYDSLFVVSFCVCVFRLFKLLVDEVRVAERRLVVVHERALLRAGDPLLAVVRPRIDKSVVSIVCMLLVVTCHIASIVVVIVNTTVTYLLLTSCCGRPCRSGRRPPRCLG